MAPQFARVSRLARGTQRRRFGSTTLSGPQAGQLELSPRSSSLLPLLQTINNVEIPSEPSSNTDPRRKIHTVETRGFVHHDLFVPFFLQYPAASALPLGLLRRSVVAAFVAEDLACRNQDQAIHWYLHQKDTLSPISANKILSISFVPNSANVSKASRKLRELLLSWRKRGMFSEILRGWSEEKCPVYLPDGIQRPNQSNGLALTVERAALPLFAFPNFTAFVIGYIKDNRTQETRLWVPRRSLTKRTFPGMLDVTAGGCMTVGESPVRTIIREAAEEASLPSSYVASHLVPANRIAFSHQNPSGWLLPGVFHCFDLKLPSDGSIEPKTNEADGEVSHFELLTPQECLEKLVAKEFKPSSALAILDFLIRHGHFTRENDPHYDLIVAELQRSVPVPMP
ncbi:hypothetical protein FRB94_003318 [Tulasnella sp. JGI-2019a]|nr:hypothetical protein FRB93_014055 [Tulasnella sp. JGI-2019a]KAG9003206.1 hypothetical protein FRB94_003318 [Tulasnella sp. JGI-2019a]